MSEMFCFQCQQTAGNKACVTTGVCGKQPETSNLQDELVCELIQLAEAATKEQNFTSESCRLIIDGLFTTLTNVNFDNDAIRDFIHRVIAERERIGSTPVRLSLCGMVQTISYRFAPPCSSTEGYVRLRASRPQLKL